MAVAGRGRGGADRRSRPTRRQWTAVDGSGRPWRKTAVSGGGWPMTAEDGRRRRKVAEDRRGPPWTAMDGRGRPWTAGAVDIWDGRRPWSKVAEGSGGRPWTAVDGHRRARGRRRSRHARVMRPCSVWCSNPSPEGGNLLQRDFTFRELPPGNIYCVHATKSRQRTSGAAYFCRNANSTFQP